MTPRVLRLLPFSCLRFVAWAFRGRGLWTFLGDAHYGGPQHALANHITWLNHLSDRTSRDVRAAHLEYCLVEIRIEFYAQRIETLNAVPFQDLVKFALNEFDPLMQGFGGDLDHGSGLHVRFQCPAQVVGHPDEVAREARDTICTGIRYFPVGAAAQVFHLGQRAQELVLVFLNFLCQRCGVWGRRRLVRCSRGIVVTGGGSRVRPNVVSLKNSGPKPRPFLLCRQKTISAHDPQFIRSPATSWRSLACH